MATKKNEFKKYTDFIMDKSVELLGIDSPTGYTDDAAAWVKKEFEKLGYKPEYTGKGGILVSLGGKKKNNGILVEGHIDTLGGMVSTIKPNGRLKISQLGGLDAHNMVTENVRIVTKFDGDYEGTYQIENASLHVNGELRDTKRTFDNCEVVIDEDVKSKEDVEKLGIKVGDIVCFETKTRITKSGYIKSRFLDDKLSVGIILGYAKYLKENKITPDRAVYVHITVYEEVGHGGCASVPEGVTEALSVDMGCVGEELNCTERQVSICSKDAGGPYAYSVVKGLMETAEKMKLDYAVDVYPHYGSDVEATLHAGYDVRHGLIGPGVYASHGYERSHRDGAENTLKLLVGYIK